MAKLKKIYKYQPINKNSIFGLLNRTLYAAKPIELNDPFDCFTRIYNENGEQNNSYRIISFSNDCLNQLLWSHYSDSNRGICLGFVVHQNGLIVSRSNFSLPIGMSVDNNNISIGLNGVRYLKEESIPNPTPDVDGPEGEYNHLFEKSYKWKYEKEYRVIIAEEYLINEFIEYPPFSLDSITFGIKTPKIEKLTIIHNLRETQGYNHLKVYQIKQKRDEYVFTREKI